VVQKVHHQVFLLFSVEVYILRNIIIIIIIIIINLSDTVYLQPRYLQAFVYRHWKVQNRELSEIRSTKPYHVIQDDA